MRLLDRLPDGTGRWLLLAVVVIPFAGYRIAKSLESDEEQLRSRVLYALAGLEARQPRRISRFLARDFVDADTGYDRSQIREWSRGLLVPGERYRGTLRDSEDEPGFKIIEMSEPDERPFTATIEVRCSIERRSKNTEFEPWWDLEFTGIMIRDGGVWKLMRSENVNHETRPRR